MCGIFGIINYSDSSLYKYQKDQIKNLVINLLGESEMRGKDASGICLLSGDKVSVFKDSVKGSDLKNFQSFEDMMDVMNLSTEGFQTIIGHTRSETKGSHSFNINNHPIMANKTIGVHNGIISNDDMLFAKYKDEIVREGQVDSEIIFRLIDMYIAKGTSIAESISETSKQLIGSYACAFIHVDHPNYVTLFKASSYPSIYLYIYGGEGLIVFASSSLILTSAVEDSTMFDPVNISIRAEVGDRQGVRINTSNGKIYAFDIKASDVVSDGYSGVVSNGYSGVCVHCIELDCDKCPYSPYQLGFQGG